MATSTENSLDRLLKYAQDYGISTVSAKEITGCHFPYHSRAVRIGAFAMQVHCHDTGNNVRVYIIGAGDPYNIIDECYWKRGGYDHNPFKHLRGAWDSAFEKAKNDLLALVFDHKNKQAILKLQSEEEKLSAEERRKLEVESLFR